jgi:hypothetical protein
MGERRLTSHLRTRAAGLAPGVPKGAARISRRDNRTQPGVLTPGTGFRKRLTLKGQKTSVGDPRLAGGLTNVLVTLPVPTAHSGRASFDS